MTRTEIETKCKKSPCLHFRMILNYRRLAREEGEGESKRSSMPILLFPLLPSVLLCNRVHGRTSDACVVGLTDSESTAQKSSLLLKRHISL